MNQQSDQSPRIGLALSGGGFRASFYHLGTIRCLEEMGLMERVEVMSTVSGGSILGTYYLVQMEKKLRANPNGDRLRFCDEIIDRFCHRQLINFRMRALVFYPFYHPIMTALSLVGLAHRGDTMARAFAKHLFYPDLRVGDLPVSDGVGRSRLLVNTTSLISGRRVVFSRESDTGLKSQIEKSDPNDLQLARVVGASAAVPGLFKPLRIAGELLVDGGVIDNQGIESLLDYFELSEDELNQLGSSMRQRNPDRKRDIYLIVSDAAGQFSVKSTTPATRAGGAARSMSVLQAANRRKTLKILQNAKQQRGARKLEGFAFTHLAMNLKGREGIDQRLPSEFIGPVAELRTDLDEFSRIERDALIYHGYTLMRSQLQRYCQALVSQEDPSPEYPGYSGAEFSWPPPFVEICKPDNPRSCGARNWISRFLSVGRTLFFRDVRRHPWQLGPIFLVFAVVAILHSWYLSGPIGGEPGRGASLIASGLSGLLSCLIPSSLVIPNVLDAGHLQAGLAEDGRYYPSLVLASQVVTIAVTCYFVTWLYYFLKRSLRLAARFEDGNLNAFRSTNAYRQH